ncbi:hypothetical protein BH09BAC6_BH09BAC6_30710 [soil metagenome]|jgi:protein CpxP
MNRLLLICFLLTGTTIACMAQSAHKTATDPKEKAKMLQKQLKLTNEQTEKIAAIYKESAEKFEKIKVKEKGDNNKMLVAMRPLRSATIVKIKAVLKPGQAAKYDELVKVGGAGKGSGWSDGWSPTSAQ